MVPWIVQKKGFVHAIAAYVLWGVLPVYWKWLGAVPVLQLLAHRIAWSFLLLVVVLVATRRLANFRAVAFERTVVGTFVISAVLIGINWLTYVWAVNAGYIVEASLGYFISPLLHVLLGVLVFRERLRPLQWLPVAMAAIGVAYLTVTYGRLPWIALTLASSFGVYGVVKKLAPLDSLYGLTMETGLLFLPAIVYLVRAALSGAGAFALADTRTDLLLAGAGIATTVPLLLFASAARRVPLSALGIMQYIAPSLQFLLGVLLYQEAFTSRLAIGFGMVWAGLVIFCVEGQLARRSAPVSLNEEVLGATGGKPLP